MAETISSLFITALIYVAPVLFYKKSKNWDYIPKKKSIIIAIVNSIIVFFIFNLFRGMLGYAVSSITTPAFFWGIVNYLILHHKPKEEKTPPSADEMINDYPQMKDVCPSCGEHIADTDSKYCIYCGEPLNKQ